MCVFWSRLLLYRFSSSRCSSCCSLSCLRDNRNSSLTSRNCEFAARSSPSNVTISSRASMRSFWLERKAVSLSTSLATMLRSVAFIALSLLLPAAGTRVSAALLILALLTAEMFTDNDLSLLKFRACAFSRYPLFPSSTMAEFMTTRARASASVQRASAFSTLDSSRANACWSDNHRPFPAVSS